MQRTEDDKMIRLNGRAYNRFYDSGTTSLEAFEMMEEQEDGEVCVKMHLLDTACQLYLGTHSKYEHQLYF